MHIGQKGCIVKVKGHGSARKRAVDAGFYKGICVEVLDMGDGSFSIDVEGTTRLLPFAEASMIEVLTTEEAAREQGVSEVTVEMLKELAHKHRH